MGTALYTLTYTYGDAGWRDKLTAFGRRSFTYDEIGNLVSDGDFSYEWQAGRQLKSISSGGSSLRFKYDHNGMRGEKTAELSIYGENTKYTFHGKLLTHMTTRYGDMEGNVHDDVLHFFYDAQSRPAMVDWNGVIYTYIHNLQGDIVGLLDRNGGLVVEYKYDAWGRPVATTGSLSETLGRVNPFRYRGYVYDEETGLYYLRSRYYNPEWGRFICSDVVLGEVGAVGSHNLFAYCVNNPVALEDPDGNFAQAMREGWQQGSAYGPWVGLACLAQNPPKINLQAKSNANAISIGSLTQSLQNAKTVNAKTKSEEIFNYDYYFAIVVGGEYYQYLMVVDYPMDMKTAAFVLNTESVLRPLLDRFNIEYLPGNMNVSYGIYTPTWIKASALAATVYGTGASESHSARGSFAPGEYYMHCHSVGHSYHIWYGQPTIFPFIE